MARLHEWMDVSEAGDAATLEAAGWTIQGNGGFGSANVTTAHPYHDAEGNGGQYSLELNAGTFGGNAWMAWRTPALATPTGTFHTRFHLYRGTLPVSDACVCFWSEGISPANSLGQLVIAADGKLKLYSGGAPNAGSGTLLATSTNALLPATQYLIEVGVTIGNSGTYEVRVNGTSVGWIPSASGDTQPGSDTTVDYFWLVSNAPTSAGDSSWFDDFVADDASFVGEGLVTAVVPRAYGHTTQLTPHGMRNNWQNVDERPPSDADYNEATAPNKKDTYLHTAAPGAASAIHAFLVLARVTAIGGAVGHGYLVTRSAGTDYEDAGHSVPFTPGVVSELLETDPATSAPWTPAGLNASEIGIRFDV